jgi:hypothetical protein
MNANISAFRAVQGIIAVSLAVVATLAGCGEMSMTTDAGSISGGGTIISGVGTGGTGVIKTAASLPDTGTGLIGAIVFLDTNNNRLADADEPFAYTDQNGSYTLQLDPAEAAAYPLLLQAVAGATINKATGQVITSSSIVALGQP